MRMKNEHRVIRRLKTLGEQKTRFEKSLKQEEEKLIRTQKEVMGDEHDDP